MYVYYSHTNKGLVARSGLSYVSVNFKRTSVAYYGADVFLLHMNHMMNHKDPNYLYGIIKHIVDRLRILICKVICR